MRTQSREDNDECSYISRLPERTEESDFGCLCSIALAMVILLVVFLTSGCSTCYVAVLRSEYSEQGKVHGIYKGQNEYPTLYPATRITTAVELPCWWCPSELRLARAYQIALWPIGALSSVLDLPISVATDTVMLPYDLTKTLEKNNKSRKGRRMTQRDRDGYWTKVTQSPKPSTKKVILDALCAETLSESIEGRPDSPTLPLVGSENVSISREEEKEIE